MYMSFDLDIESYGKSELEDIFSLPKDYDDSILDMNESKLKENTMNDPSIELSMKTKIIQFITKAKKMLLAYKNDDTKDKEISSYVSLHPSDYFPPILNPVVGKQRTQNLNIDTRFRESYYTTQSSNFHINLPLKIYSALSMELAAIEFPPTTFFNISKMYQNNYFWLRAGSTENGDLEEQLVTVPDGNYTATDAVELINSFLATLTSTTYIQYIYFSVNSSASTNSGSGQLIIAVKSNYPYQSNPFPFVIDLQAGLDGSPDYYTPLPLKLGWMYGLRNGIYQHNSAYLSEGVVNLNGPRYVYLVVDDYNNANNDTFVSAFTSSVLNKNILARMGVQSSKPDLATTANISIVSSPREYSGPVDIEKMQVQMLDEYGRVLNLNNMDFSFCLKITIGLASQEK
jgi:hypothetical protein